MTDQESRALATSLYVSILGRAPDKSGLDYWSGKLAGGLPLRDTIGFFLSSDEGVAQYGFGVSSSAFITNLYQNILNRTADAGGAAFWAGRLGEVGSRAEMVEQFIGSVTGGTGTDAQLMKNKVDFGLTFAASKSGNNVSYAKILLANVTSDPASVSLAKLVSEYVDNPPAVVALVVPPVIPVVPPKVPLDFYGKSLKFLFYVNDAVQWTATSVVDDSVEAGIDGFTLDLGHNSFKISTTVPFTTMYVDPSKLVLTDVNNSFDPFIGFNVLSNSFVMALERSGYNPANITVSENSIEIIMTGVDAKIGAALEFSILT